MPSDTALIGDRYRLTQLLGRGGMASVYRAEDLVSGRVVALKQLTMEPMSAQRGALASLFEREFRTLVQLRHPHVIAVYDFGLAADDSPYYTMELLDGGDLRDRAPLPWREVCRLLFAVCSSLALLHSRRLLHRDISPRNIRCTQDGRAKLIDFGAMTAMSAGGADVVGTPAFVAPETFHRLALDARTDLFSLGATLYHALTGRLPYLARSFADALIAWRDEVEPPSTWHPDIPAALDDLVLALISVEPALRPQSAFEVMQRLAAIAGLPASESEAVSRAYLVTPTLVGRERALDQFREELLAARMNRGGALWIEGPAGVGRSRLLDACALEAKTLGFTVMRETVSAARDGFSAAHGLTQHLLEALPIAELRALPQELLAPVDLAADSGKDARPTLRDFADLGLDAETLQRAICRLWLGAGDKRPLLIAVDDVHRIDSRSAAVLVALLDKTQRASVFVALCADTDEPANDATRALSRRCTTLTVEALTQEQTHRLLGSLFGDVPNLDMLAHEIHASASGNPRQCLDSAQQLVDRELVRYAAGTWTLPSRLSAHDLPRSVAEARRARLARLSQAARFMAEAHALAFYDSLRAADYHALLPEASSAQIEEALAELLASEVLVEDGAQYLLSNRLWSAALSETLTPAELALRQRALAAMYGAGSRIALIYHAFAGGLDELALEALSALNAELAIKLDSERLLELNVGKMMACYPRALASAQRLGKSPRALNELRRWHLAGSVTQDELSFPDSARLWLAQLERDSGLDLYRADPDTSDPAARMMRALQGAQARYLATPEAERVYPVDEAIRLLAEYVVIGLAISSRSQDYSRLRSLPSLLEPFVSLSPVLDAIWNNAVATYVAAGEGRHELARERWIAVLGKLDAMADSDVKHAKEIASAVAFGIGCMEAHLGLSSVSAWADRLERDPYQRVSALQLRRIERLQQGDSKGAERFRRQAELSALRRRGTQMFSTLLVVELAACAKARDLAGVQEALTRIRQLAVRYPGWVPNLLYGEACFSAVRGDFVAAKQKCEACSALTAFGADGVSLNATMWFAAQLGLSEALLQLGAAADARAAAAHALEVASARYPGDGSIELERALALAEARLGEPQAATRLEAAIARQLALGISGLQLGLSYEARAQIAIWCADATAFDHYAELTAREYRYGADSGLGVRYGRLINDAGRHGLRAKTALADLAVPSPIVSTRHSSADLAGIVERTMARTRRARERAQAALQLICASRHASCGHLYTASPEGLVWSASLGDCPPPAASMAALHDALVKAEARERAIDEITTGEPLAHPDVESSIAVDGTEYALLPLSYAVEGAARAVAVAAVAVTAAARDPWRQKQLLEVVALHLAQASDD